MTTTTHNSLATIIGSPDLNEISKSVFLQWSENRLDDCDPYARLHKKFWGTSMEEEERQWRASQATAGDGDDDNRFEEDDDIIPGCYLLNYDIGGEFEDLKIWVRAEYKRIYGYVENHYNMKSSIPSQAPAAVVTGQPGIGKSTWGLYALRRRLAE